MKSIVYVGLGAALLCLPIKNASAIPLAPGGLVPAVGEADPVGGSVVATTGAIPWASSTITGTLTTTVLSGDGSNPYGGLTFTYEINVTGFPLHSVESFSIDGFGSFLTDVSFQIPPTGITPTFIRRDPSGSEVTFSFVTPSISVGAASALLVIQTDATQLFASTAFIQNSTDARNIATFAPAVPDQTNLGILFIGLAGLGVAGVCFRRQATATAK